jgi:hypothetical protein
MWACAAGVVAAVVVYIATTAALGMASPLWNSPITVLGDFSQLALRMIVLLGILGPPVVVAIAAGRRARWWYAVIACQAAGAASVAVALALAPNQVGFGLAIVAATSWAAGAAVAGVACAARRWGTC